MMEIQEKKIHKHGFVRLVDIMGSDGDIADAARVSYGKGTRAVSDNRNLIRYLVRHKHTSPLEMASIKFHLKLPIFVMRQLVRHRTAKLNEYSTTVLNIPQNSLISIKRCHHVGDLIVPNETIYESELSINHLVL